MLLPPHETNPGCVVMSELSARARLEERRERHRARSAPVRLGVLTGGWLLAGSGLLLLVLTPEVAVPLLLVALRVLALRFDWAATRYVWMAERADRLRQRWPRLRQWWRGQPVLVRWLIPVAVLALIAASVVPRVVWS